MTNKKIKIVRNNILNKFVYECSICKHFYHKKSDAIYCYEKCNDMVLAYMDINNISREDAIKMFLMEIL